MITQKTFTTAFLIYGAQKYAAKGIKRKPNGMINRTALKAAIVIKAPNTNIGIALAFRDAMLKTSPPSTPWPREDNTYK